MRVVLLTSDYAWHRALANRLMSIPGVILAGVIVQEIPSSMSLRWVRRAVIKQPLSLASKVLQRLFYSGVFAEIDREEIRQFGRHGTPLPWPTVQITRVRDINAQQAVTRIKALEPDLIAVSGTKLIKEPIFDLKPPSGLVNLHSGISPYYKGGPNCTLWCLANQEPQFIGSTVHVLTMGIDSGPILMSAQAHIAADDTLARLVCKAVATGHDLCMQTVQAMADGRQIESVPQDEIGKGRTYLMREWNVLQLARAARYVRSGQLARWVESGRPGMEKVKVVNASGVEVKIGSVSGQAPATVSCASYGKVPKNESRDESLA